MLVYHTFFGPEERAQKALSLSCVNEKEISSSYVHILSYNIAGLKNKLNDVKFVELLNQYDIFLLFETFINEERDFAYVQEKFNCYELKWIPAVRLSRFGRPSGGKIYGRRREPKCDRMWRFVKLGNYDVLQYGGFLEKTYLIPIYINCNNWDSEYALLYDCLLTYERSNFLLIGDFNGRISNKQVLPKDVLVGPHRIENLMRNSKDNVLNKNGKQLLALFEDLNLLVLNGRMADDEDGDFTFIGGGGSSVIDYCVVSMSLIPIIDAFEVKTEIFSDHLPIATKIRSLRGDPVCDMAPILPKFRWSKTNANEYRRKLEEAIDSGEPLDDDPKAAVSNLIKMIQDCAEPRGVSTRSRIGNSNGQVWFDETCQKERKRLFKILNAYRRTNSETIKCQYLESNKLFKRLCAEKRESHFNKYIDRMNNVKVAKDFWKIVRMFKKKQFNLSMTITPEDWIGYFGGLFESVNLVNSICYAEPYVTDDILDIPFTKSELYSVLKNVKDNKAPGEDRISYEFYKNAPEKFIVKLLDTFVKIYETGQVPESFKKSIIFPIHKKGNIDNVTNYRGISFSNTIGKLFSGLLLNRIERWVAQHNVLKEFQAGFRKNYSTVDNLFSLISIINIGLSRGQGKVYAFFVDLSSAFDRINRHALFYKLSEIGLSFKAINVIREIYNGSNAVVWTQSGLTDGFETCTGVKQGCVLSPILFSLFMNDIDEHLEGGVQINNINIKLLAYADDIVLLASDKLSLKKMLQAFELYCSKWNLEVNLSKSKIIVFRNGGRLSRHEKWWFRNEEVDVTSQYKYLGMNLTPRLSFAAHFREKSSKAKLALNSFNSIIFNKKIPFASKMKIFEAVARSITCYGAQIWGSRIYESVESVQRYFIKKVFGLPRNAPDHSLYLETGLSLVFLHTLQMQLNFVSRCKKLSQDRYPRFLLEEVIRKKVYIFKDWEELRRVYDVSIMDFFEERVNAKVIIAKIRQKITDGWRTRLFASRSRILHPVLQTFTEYIYSKHDSTVISWLLRARAELMYLNKYSTANGITICSMCNMNEEEDVVHFIARCPILSEFRMKYFKVRELSLDKLEEYLNGKDWLDLSNYCKTAWQYRYSLIREFNY
jgi:hypothetical protein